MSAPAVVKLSAVHVQAPLRLAVSLGLGLLAAVLLALLAREAPWELRALAGWMVFSATYLLLSWRVLFRADGDWIRKLSQEEDNGKRAAGALVLSAALISLAGVMLTISRASTLKDQPLLTGLMIGGGLLSVALSWLLIQTVYIFRYAHLYYEEPEGGVQFPGTSEPDYLDFAYFAFTLGMTYQVSDTDIDQRKMRRLATLHGLISYVFGVVIIALAISVTSSLLS